MDHELWQMAANYRGRPQHEQFRLIVEEIKARGLRVSLEDLAKMSKQLRVSAQPSCPDFVVDFVSSYLTEEDYNFLDEVGTGTTSILPRLLERLQPKKAVGITISEDEQAALQTIDFNCEVYWLQSDILKQAEFVQDDSEVILGTLPWNQLPRTKVELGDNSEPITLKDTQDHLALSLAALKMKQDGVGIFVVSASFFSRSSNFNVVSKLADLGLYLEAAIHIPQGFEPAANAHGYLLILRKKKLAEMFVGQLSPENEANESLLSNLKCHQEGKTTQLGALVALSDFYSFPSFAASRDIVNTAHSMGLKPISVSALTVEDLHLKDPKLERGFEEKSNALYLPLIGNSPVVTSLDALHIKPQNYIQLVLDPEKAMSSYLADLLNTSFGLKIRESFSQGVIPKMSKSTLKEAYLYLPSLDVQAEVLRVDSNITDLSTQLSRNRKRLWNHPRAAQEVDKQVGKINQKEGFESWMESLPFPLASILRTYHAKNNPIEKFHHLVHFFEAVSQFTCTLLLSALHRDDSLLNEVVEEWKSDQKEKWLTQATFGNWHHAGRQLASKIRRYMDETEGRERIHQLFGYPDRDFLNAITSKKLHATLGKAKDIRNQKLGHTGVVNEKTSRRKLQELEPVLSELMSAISDSYETMQLLQPTESSFKGGIYNYTARLLKGTKLPFNEIEVQTVSPMENEELYLLNEGRNEPVLLLPFFRLMESPRTEQNACYFYNRIEKEGIRWISYHFDTEDEFVRPDTGVMSTLSLLMSKG